MDLHCRTAQDNTISIHKKVGVDLLLVVELSVVLVVELGVVLVVVWCGGVVLVAVMTDAFLRFLQVPASNMVACGQRFWWIRKIKITRTKRQRE